VLKLGLVVAFAVLLAATLLLLLLPGGLREESRAGAPVLPRLELPEAAPPRAVADSLAPTSRSDLLPDSKRVAAAEAQPRGILRGRLVEAGTGAPLHTERIVLLASPRNAVAESLRTGPDGSFASARRFPRGPVRAWVSEPETHALLARHEAEFEPASPDAWLVPVPRSPPPGAPSEVGEVEVALHGLVVDLAGLPVEGAQVKLFSLAAPGEVSCGSATDAAGEFRLQDLARGPHRLLVQGRFASSAPSSSCSKMAATRLDKSCCRPPPARARCAEPW
jgi:hypothetical protein